MQLLLCKICGFPAKYLILYPKITLYIRNEKNIRNRYRHEQPWMGCGR